MPDGDVSGGGFPVVDILEGPEVPGTGVPTGPVGTFVESVVSFFSGLFGGTTKFPAPPGAQQRFFEARTAALAAGLDPQPSIDDPAGQEALSEFLGRLPIPTPEQGGPELVTERFRNLPPILDAPEFSQGPLGFEGISIMPVDVPLLAGFQSLLPAIRGITQPTIQGAIGGLAGGFLSEFLRPIQETGLGTVPMRQQVPQVSPGGCPPAEKPHTRILRFIKMNTGVSIKLSRAKSLIRELGLEGAARCLGVTVSEVCSLLIVRSPRRRIGISAADIRIVKRTARRFESLKHALGHLGGRPGHHHHRRSKTRHSHK